MYIYTINYYNFVWNNKKYRIVQFSTTYIYLIGKENVMNGNESKVVELNCKLCKIKLNRDLNILASGALTLIGTSNFVVISNAPVEESMVESAFFFLGAIDFGANAIKKNRQVKILKKQINKLRK